MDSPIGLPTTWNGDVDEVVALIRRSWRASYPGEAYYDFDAEYLRWCIDSPDTDPSRLFELRRGGRLIAFLAYLNRTYQWRGNRFPGVFSTFLTMDPDLSGRRVGPTFVLETLKRLKAGFRDNGDPAIVCFYTEVRHGTERMFRRIASQLSSPLQRIRRWRVGLRPLDVDSLAQLERTSLAERLVLKAVSGIRPSRERRRTRSGAEVLRFEPSHLETCLALANEASAAQAFAPVWHAGNLRHQLTFERMNRTLVVRRDSRVQGFINLRIAGLNGIGERQRIAAIDWVSCARLTRGERRSLMKRVLQETEQAGCAGVMLPRVPAMSSVRSPAFLPTPRRVDLFCYNFSPETLRLEKTRAAYEIMT